MTEAYDILIRSFVRSLKGRNLSDRTVRTYELATRDLARWATGRGLADWDQVGKAEIQEHLAELTRTRTPGGVSIAYRSVQQFYKWAAEEDEITPNPMTGMKPPVVPEGETPVLREPQIKALLKVCQGADFAARRDLAIISLFLDTGLRLDELAGLTMERLDVDMCEARVQGKGRRPRTVAFGRRTAVTLDRYLRVRRKHKHADSPALWLPERAGPVAVPLMSNGIHIMLRRRGDQVGIPMLRAHIFRHTWAHHARLDGRLHDDEVMRLAGWRSRQMLNRYSASAAGERALDAGKRTALGDRL